MSPEALQGFGQSGLSRAGQFVVAAPRPALPAGGAVNAYADMDPNIEHPNVEQFVVTVEHQVTKAKFVASLTCQGVQTGERVIIELAPKKGKGFKTK